MTAHDPLRDPRLIAELNKVETDIGYRVLFSFEYRDGSVQVGRPGAWWARFSKEEVESGAWIEDFAERVLAVYRAFRGEA